MALPNRIRVQLIAQQSADLSGILVELDLRASGSYYYGALVGLTDQAGVAEVSRADLEVSFQQDRTLFPMDYRLPLDQCDPQILVRVAGGEDFLMARAAARDGQLVSDASRALWMHARNATLVPAATMVTLSHTPPDTVSIALEIQSGEPVDGTA